MKVACNLENLLSKLEEYRSRGVEDIYLEMDDELGGLKIAPISTNQDVRPTIVGKTAML